MERNMGTMLLLNRQARLLRRNPAVLPKYGCAVIVEGTIGRAMA
jgi:hypothetical protein